MIDYENLEIERRYSNYPVGLKHFSKDEIFESSLFDIDMIAYKVARILKGECNEEANQENGTKDEVSEEEVL